MILVLLLLSCLIAVSEGTPHKVVFSSDISLENYIQLFPDLSRASHALTVCSWVKPYVVSDSTNRYWLSYSVEDEYNEIVMADKPSKVYLFGDDMDGSDSTIPVNEWSHLCQTWDALSRFKTFYIDGVKIESVITPTGRNLTAKGSLIFGQEQDSMGGGFDIGQSYAGELFGTHILSVALSEEQVALIYRTGLCFDISQSIYSRNVEVSWHDIMGADWYGDVAAKPMECNGWDKLRAFVGQTITNEFIDYLKLHSTPK